MAWFRAYCKYLEFHFRNDKYQSMYTYIAWTDHIVYVCVWVRTASGILVGHRSNENFLNLSLVFILAMQVSDEFHWELNIEAWVPAVIVGRLLGAISTFFCMAPTTFHTRQLSATLVQERGQGTCTVYTFVFRVYPLQKILFQLFDCQSVYAPLLEFDAERTQNTTHQRNMIHEWPNVLDIIAFLYHFLDISVQSRLVWAA